MPASLSRVDEHRSRGASTNSNLEIYNLAAIDLAWWERKPSIAVLTISEKPNGIEAGFEIGSVTTHDMYIPRSLSAQLYQSLLSSCTPASPPILLLPAASDPDALCATRILTALLKRDFIPHKIHPVGGYADLERAGQSLIQPMKYSEGGNGGIVVCLGVGGLIDLANVLGFESDETEEEAGDEFGGVEIWVFDKRRPWNLGNVFGGMPTPTEGRPLGGVQQGRIGKAYRSGKGGIVVFDDGDIEDDLDKQKDAFFALAEMPEVEDDDSVSDESEDDDTNDTSNSRKRKSIAGGVDEDSDNASDEETRPHQRRRSNSVSGLRLPRTKECSSQIRVLRFHQPAGIEHPYHKVF